MQQSEAWKVNGLTEKSESAGGTRGVATLCCVSRWLEETAESVNVSDLTGCKQGVSQAVVPGILYTF